MSDAPFVRWLESRRPWVRGLVALSMVGLVALVDLSTGPELSVSVLYLLPLALVAWIDGWVPGVVASTACAAAWGFANHIPGLPHGPGVAVWNTGALLVLFLVVASTLHALRSSRRREALLARTDDLTGVLNVRGFREAAEGLLARARRRREPVVVLVVDLDDLESVNASLGHEEGDRLLAIVGNRLRSRFRRSDLVGRLGGDEFAVILSDARAEDVHRLVETAMRTLRDRLEREGSPSGASAGWVAYEIPPANLDDALQVAERRLRRARAESASEIPGGPPD